MLTGICIGQGETLPYDEEYQHFQCLFSVLPHFDLHDELSSELQHRCSYIKQTIMELIHVHSFDNCLEIARFFILYMMENLFFTNASNTLPAGYVAAVMELSFDSPVSYDVWTPLLGYLYHSLDHRCVVGVDPRPLQGFGRFYSTGTMSTSVT